MLTNFYSILFDRECEETNQKINHKMANTHID